MEGERAAKRARRACLNCRRKKTRCSGEMPTCNFCARLDQPCMWDIDRYHTGFHRDSFFNTPDSALAARVALLESKLSTIGVTAPSDARVATVSSGTTNPGSANGHLKTTDTEPNSQDPSQGLSSLPAKPTLSKLIDNYFMNCHNQPYAFFHEATFRQRFEENVLPDSLLLAVAATACRFTNESTYWETSSDISTSYAGAAWVRIFEQSFSYEDDLDIAVVQALSMLAVVDFTAGHPRHGWVKVALAVRFAQALRLNEEPDSELPAWEREERRRTFWSMYLLDRLISLGPNRPPSFSDNDCTLHLPGSDEAFLNGVEGPEMPTIGAVIYDTYRPQYWSLDYFALTTVMACTLGQLIRFSLKRSPLGRYVPWDSRSPYYQIHSMLLQHESHSLLTYTSLKEVLQSELTLGTTVNHQRTGHLIFSQTLFHVNHCLLNHPFILYNLFQRSTAPVPLSFAREALHRSFTSAAELLDLIHEAQIYGRLAESSFFGYCAMLSGVIFRLYEHDQDAVTAATSKRRVEGALEYLERKPIRWKFHPIMAAVLRSFTPTMDLARSLIEPINLAQKAKINNAEELWSLIDYASLQGTSHSGPSVRSATSTQTSRAEETAARPTFEDNGITSTSPSAIFSKFGDEYWAERSDVRSYLGEDMAGVWSEVFNQRWMHGT